MHCGSHCSSNSRARTQRLSFRGGSGILWLLTLQSKFTRPAPAFRFSALLPSLPDQTCPACWGRACSLAPAQHHHGAAAMLLKPNRGCGRKMDGASRTLVSPCSYPEPSPGRAHCTLQHPAGLTGQHPHLIEGETRAWRGEVTCPGPHSQQSAFTPQPSGMPCCLLTAVCWGTDFSQYQCHHRQVPKE